MPRRIIALCLLLASSASPAMAHHRHPRVSYHRDDDRHHRQDRYVERTVVRRYRQPAETTIVTTYEHPNVERVVERTVVTRRRHPLARREYRTEQRHHRTIHAYNRDADHQPRTYPSQPYGTPVSNQDTNSCLEGSVIGGLLGAGLGAVLSRGEGRWVGVPLGGAAGALVGCQVDGG